MTAIIVELSPDTFDVFWTECPRKVGKMQARAIWDAIISEGYHTRNQNRDSGLYVNVFIDKTDPRKIIDGMIRYRKNLPMKDYEYVDPQYIMHPSTWLNRGGWDDG